MQLSQLFRQGIVRPQDDSAASQLAAQEVQTPIRVEWLPIPNQEQFDRIWAAGVFQRIGDTCGVWITDYEEVELKAGEVRTALLALGEMEEPDAEVAQFLEKLRALLAEAAAARQSVYFVL